MLVPAPFLLVLLLLLGAPQAGLSQRSSKAGSSLSCLHTALLEAEKSQRKDTSLLIKRAFPALHRGDLGPGGQEEEDTEKRTFPGSGGGGGGGGAGSTRYKYPSQAQFQGRPSQDKAKSDRRTKVTLSLDVPTNIMNILFNIAKAKNLRAKAAANAHLMAQIGRKK
ncbi:LOW QUALITY PROTEIN: urocortin-3 [Cervus canadensis]|uniref:LOW QUALITY PROTEIN: urocortin-3 n=1 Tax=Cervus canadensis TaxID=1574408 RepID=UPI001C9E8BBE|nr:LOW QUALITY PROTEIN: urocortin-3 [Cervus canadensis]